MFSVFVALFIFSIAFGAPTVVRISPPSGTTTFAIGDRIVISVDSPVAVDANSVAYLSAKSRTTTIPITAQMVSENVITIIPQVEGNVDYILSIPRSSLKSSEGVAFSGVANYRFRTLDTYEPVLSSTIPVDGGFISPSGPITLTYNEPVMVTGNWTATLTCDDIEHSLTPSQTSTQGNSLFIQYEMPNFVECELVIEASSIADVSGNEFLETIRLNFNTTDNTVPTLSMSLLPIDDITAASHITDIILTVEDNSPVTLNFACKQKLVIQTQNLVIEYLPSQLTLSDNELVIPNDVLYYGVVSITVPSSFIVDQFGNGNAVFSAQFTTTTDTTVPQSPTLVSHYADIEGTIEITFSSFVTIGTGSVTLTPKDSVHDIVVIPSSSLETHDNKLIIHYSGLVNAVDYTIKLDAKTVYNIFGNGNPQTSLTQSISVRQQLRPSIIKESCYPHHESTSIPMDINVRIVFNMAVKVSATCTLSAVSADDVAIHISLTPYTPTTFETTKMFSALGMRPYTQYIIQIPANCFVNDYEAGNAAESISFRTTRDTPPHLIQFNLESLSDVLLDDMVKLVFDQEIVLKGTKEICVMPRDDGHCMYRELTMVDTHTAILYNHQVSHRFTPDTVYQINIPNAVVCNTDNLCMGSTTTGTFTTTKVAVNNVILLTTTPRGGSSNVDANTTVILHFSSPVRLTTAPSVKYQISEEGTMIEGTAVIIEKEVHLTFPLRSGKAYTYIADMNQLCTVEGYPIIYDIFAQFTFTTIDTEPPQYYSFTTKKMNTMEIRFDESVMNGEGSVTVYNSKQENLGSFKADTMGRYMSAISIAINLGSVADDMYSFVFEEDFVHDVIGNMNEPFTIEYAYDNINPFITNVTNPDTLFSPVVFIFNEDVKAQDCTITIVDKLKKVYKISGTTLIQPSSNTLAIEPMIKPDFLQNGFAWEGGMVYEVTFEKICVVDTRKMELGSTKSFTFQSPPITKLEVNGENSVPAIYTTQSKYDVLENGVAIQFSSNLMYIDGKTISLRNALGCVLYTTSHHNNNITLVREEMYIQNNTLVFESKYMNVECLSGVIHLIMDKGALMSTESGSMNDASTTSSSMYSFSMLPNSPVPTNIVAVYKNGLTIQEGVSIQITFNKVIVPPTTITPSMTKYSITQSDIEKILEFRDMNDEVVGLAVGFKGEIENKSTYSIMTIIVTEPFSPLLTKQIRSVHFFNVIPANGITSAPSSDSLSGTFPLSRVFNIPIIQSVITVEYEDEEHRITSILPLVTISFTQDVSRSLNRQCHAIILQDGLTALSAYVDSVVEVDSRTFTWKLSPTQALHPHTNYTLLVDHTCFIVLSTHELGVGVSEEFLFTTGSDSVGPIFLGFSTINEEMSDELNPVTESLSLVDSVPLGFVFSEEIEIVTPGFIRFKNVDDGTVVVVASEDAFMDERFPNTLFVRWWTHALVSVSSYSVSIEAACQDLLGNLMVAASSTQYVVTTPSTRPLPIQGMKIEMIQATTVILSFNAAVDTNIVGEVSTDSYCHYQITADPSLDSVYEFDDVCVGATHAEPIELSVILDNIDPEMDYILIARVKNNVVSSYSDDATINLTAPETPVPNTPIKPILHNVKLVEVPSKLYAFELMITPPNTYGQVIQSYTILAETVEGMEMREVEYDSTTQLYSTFVNEKSSIAYIRFYVKCVTAGGSSGYSTPLTVNDPFKATTVPSGVKNINNKRLSYNSIRLSWTHTPDIHNTYTTFELNVSVNGVKTDYTTDSTSFILTNMMSGYHTVLITSVNSVGKTTVSHGFTFAFTVIPTLKEVKVGHNYAVANVDVNFGNCVVECVLNAGHLISGNGLTNSSNRAVIILTGLIPGFSYSGRCWAYSLDTNLVSNSITLVFRTTDVAQIVELSVSELEITKNGVGSVSVDISVPATIYCVLSAASITLLHGDIVHRGQAVVMDLSGPHTLSFVTIPNAAPFTVQCTAEDSAHKRIASIYVSDEITYTPHVGLIDSPTITPAHHATQVSLSTQIVLTYSKPVVVQLGPAHHNGAIVVEDMATGEKQVLDKEELIIVNGNVVTVSLLKKLVPSTTYSLYFTRPDIIIDQASKQFPERLTRGAHTFTTTTDSTKPILIDIPSIVNPSEPLVLGFSKEMKLPTQSLTQLSLASTPSMLNLYYSASAEEKDGNKRIVVNGEMISIPTLGLKPETTYTLTIPECYFEDVYGNCVDEITRVFKTSLDSVRPVVSHSVPVDGNVNVPNDLPISFVFNKKVVLNDVNKVKVMGNNIAYPLTSHDIKVMNHNEVVIDMRKGYSRGSSHMDLIQVSVVIEEDAFKDMGGLSNEVYRMEFDAVPTRCGSSFIATYIDDVCECYRDHNKCYCKCGMTTLFEM